MASLTANDLQTIRASNIQEKIVFSVDLKGDFKDIRISSGRSLGDPERQALDALEQKLTEDSQFSRSLSPLARRMLGAVIPTLKAGLDPMGNFSHISFRQPISQDEIKALTAAVDEETRKSTQAQSDMLKIVLKGTEFDLKHSEPGIDDLMDAGNLLFTKIGVDDMRARLGHAKNRLCEDRARDLTFDTAIESLMVFFEFGEKL